MWIIILEFGLNSWTKINSRTHSWFSRVSIGSWTYNSWIQTISSSHIFFIGHRYRHDDSVMIFQDWSCKGNKFHEKIFHDPIHIIRDCNYVNRKEVNKCEFREPPHYFDWVTTLDPIRPLLEPPPLGNIFLSFLLFYAFMHSFIHWEQCIR